MQFKKPLILFYILLMFQTVQSQNQYKDVDFISPVDFNILLSGSYGELRSTHFHAGIDIKTGGIIGKNIYTVTDGYVSRIKVSANGYGKTLYINHPNGLTTVYAHLHKFNDKIEKIVKDIQYAEREFEINYFPKPDDIVVKKGEVIGLSGNSGSSLGPHLHFEVRETDSQIPLNPLSFRFHIKDNIPPVFYNLIIYPLDNYSFINNSNEKKILKLKKVNGKYQLQDSIKLILSGNFGLGVEIYDYLNNTRNRCGISTLKFFLNDKLIIDERFNYISFLDAAYVKSHMDYEEKIKSKKSIHKLFIEPNNKLNIYKDNINRGIFNINTDSLFKIKIIATDSYNNLSELNLDFVGNKPEILSTIPDTLPEFIMAWNKSNTFIDEEIKIEIPEGALYNSINFEYSKTKTSNGYYSDIHHVQNVFTPIHKRYSLSIKTKNLSDELKEKAFIAYIDEENEINYIGGEMINNYIVSEPNGFGDFVVLVDTVSPEVTIKNNGENIIFNNKISFEIKDELSGIKTYNGFIDNNWALFEYDAKNDLLYYIIDDQKIEKNTEHELELFVVDNNDNVSTYYTNFYW